MEYEVMKRIFNEKVAKQSTVECTYEESNLIDQSVFRFETYDADIKKYIYIKRRGK